MDYDPLLTMSALNLAVVSLHRITSAKDRLILDSEYRSIINNLRMGEINADHELTSFYQEIVKVIQNGRLRAEERIALEAGYSERKSRSIRKILTENVMKSFDINPVEWLGNLTRSCVADYFDSLREDEEQKQINYDENLRLKREELEEYNELQRKLLDSSWKLLRMYQLPDNYRLIQNVLDKFYAAMQENDFSKRLRMLKYIEGEFMMYSPYWYYRAKSAQQAGNKDEAEKCFAKFGEVWRPVLRRDPYKAEAMKFRVNALASEGISNKNTGEILKCLAEIRENVELEDWANNIYLGMMYFTLGNKEKAIESVMCNIDFGFETENSGVLLKRFDRETPAKKFAVVSENPKVVQNPRPAEQLKKQSLKARAENGDVEAQYQLGLSYENRGYLLKKYDEFIAWCAGLIVCCAGFYFMRSSSFWWNIPILACAVVLGLIAGKVTVDWVFRLGEYYSEQAKNSFSKIAENGHVEAMYRLAKIYRKNYEDNEAIRWYKNAAVRGHIPSQRALSELHEGSSDGYMWAYLAYLCGGTENLGNKPEPRHYNSGFWFNESSIEESEKEALRIFNNMKSTKEA